MRTRGRPYAGIVAQQVNRPSVLVGRASMSSTEAELVALAECAIELLHVIGLVRFLVRFDGPVEVVTRDRQ